MKLKRGEFGSEQPKYRYMPIGNTGYADVFIYEFVEKTTNDDGDDTYIYDMNEFRVGISVVTEDMIKDNPSDYLNYPNDDDLPDLEERISAIEEALIEIAEVVSNG